MLFPKKDFDPESCADSLRDTPIKSVNLTPGGKSQRSVCVIFEHVVSVSVTSAVLFICNNKYMHDTKEG